MRTPQIAALAAEFDAATEKALALAASVTDQVFLRRPGPERWSAAECVHHLNLTTTAFLPLLDGAIQQAAAIPRPSHVTYRRDLVGWLLSWALEPPYRQRLKTTPLFVPIHVWTKDELLRDFGRLQQDLIQRLDSASGLDLSRARITSPFNERMRYNVYSCFKILAAHERRHLWQAEQGLHHIPRNDNHPESRTR